MAPLARRLAAEALGTALLVAAVVGSGVMAERLFPSADGLALVANTIATGAALVALILALGGVSAHFNPLVSAAAAVDGALAWKDATSFASVQILGGLAGVAVAHIMFGDAVVQVSPHVRTGWPLWTSEAVATFGLLLTVAGAAAAGRVATALGVGAYITAAYWFTASTSFANPAVTIARAFTATFAGIRPADVVPFIAAQSIGAAAAVVLSRWLFPRQAGSAG